MPDPASERIIEAVIAELEKISKENGFSQNIRAVERWTHDPDWSPKPPMVEIQRLAERKDRQGSDGRLIGLSATLSFALATYIASEPGSSEPMDRVLGWAIDDVERTIWEKVDWDGLNAQPENTESVPFQVEDGEEIYDGFLTAVEIVYQTEPRDIRQVLGPYK